MPQIVEYTNKENIQPTDRGTEAFTQAGRRIGASFNQVAESKRDFGNRVGQNIGSAIRDAGDAAVAWKDQSQIHQLATSSAGVFNQLTTSQNDVVNAVDPNDPAYSSKVDEGLKKWREEKLEPALQQLRDGATTEKAGNWAEQHIDQMRQHFYTTSTAEVGRAASLGIKTGMENTLTTLGNTVVQDPSPTTLKTALSLWDSSAGGIVGSAHGVQPGVASTALTTLSEAGRKHLVNQSAAAAIQKAPDPVAEAQQRIKDWPQYITGDEALKLGRAAESQRKLNEYHDKSVEQFRRQEGRDAVDADVAKNMSDNTKIDRTTGKVTINPKFFDQVTDMLKRNGDAPNAASTARSYIDWAQQQMKEKKENVVSDPNTMGNLYKNLWSTDNPTTAVDILNAETTGKLSRYDAQNMTNLHKAIEDQPLNTAVFKGTMRAVEEAVGMGVLDDGHERYANFIQQFIPKYQAMARAGTLPPDALNMNDPNSLISKSLEQFKPNQNDLFTARLLKRAGVGGTNFENLQNAFPGAKPPGNIPMTGPESRKGLAPPKPVKSIEDAQKLNPGTRYQTPDGRIFTR